MTAFPIPARVATNIAKREAAEQTARRCIYDCDATARPYPAGWRCDVHAPWALAGQPSPDTQIDPARTVDGLRTRLSTQPVAPVQQIRPTPPADTISERFLAFHQQNPHVYARVVELVADAILRGDKRIGVGALFEQLRYSERTETNGDRYRLNNDFRAPLVRLLAPGVVGPVRVAPEEGVLIQPSGGCAVTRPDRPSSPPLTPYVKPPRAVLIALADPGAITPRRFDLGPEHDEMEPLTAWQARALADAGLLGESS